MTYQVCLTKLLTIYFQSNMHKKAQEKSEFRQNCASLMLFLMKTFHLKIYKAKIDKKNKINLLTDFVEA